jgi:hypothetical protein
MNSLETSAIHESILGLPPNQGVRGVTPVCLTWPFTMGAPDGDPLESRERLQKS